MQTAHEITGHFEGMAYGLAGAMANCLENGRANAAARREADAQARQDAETLTHTAQIARAMTSDRLVLRRLQAENDALRAEMSALQQRAARAEAALIRVRR